MDPLLIWNSFAGCRFNFLWQSHHQRTNESVANEWEAKERVIVPKVLQLTSIECRRRWWWKRRVEIKGSIGGWSWSFGAETSSVHKLEMAIRKVSSPVPVLHSLCLCSANSLTGSYRTGGRVTMWTYCYDDDRDFRVDIGLCPEEIQLEIAECFIPRNL